MVPSHRQVALDLIRGQSGTTRLHLDEAPPARLASLDHDCSVGNGKCPIRVAELNLRERSHTALWSTQRAQERVRELRHGPHDSQ